MDTNTNLGGVALDNELTGRITSAELTNYLAKKLNVPVLADFLKYGGTSPFESYVRMRLGITDEYAIMPANSGTSAIDDLLRYTNKANIKKSILDVLGKYMYPQDLDSLKQLFKNVTDQKLQAIGLYGENLKDLITHIKPVHAEGSVGFYLRPELILKDMVIDPTDTEPGTFKIDLVEANADGGITWSVRVNKKVNRGVIANPNAVASLDRIFSTVPMNS